jgi:hypothetical protein
VGGGESWLNNTNEDVASIVEVAFFVLGNTPLPPTTEDRLLALLHSRAEAHEL